MSKVPGLEYAETTANGVRTHYFVGGQGPAVVFLHGWGLAGTPLYFRGLSQLTQAGYRVYAPLLPGLGSSDLPADRFSLGGYAQWVADFADAVGIEGRITLIGYSFGGGIAIRTAHDYPLLVDRLVLVNSIGGSAWRNGAGIDTHLNNRSVWDWGRGMAGDLADSAFLRLLPSLGVDSLRRLTANSGAVWRSARLARTADLTAELRVIKFRGLAVAMVWSRQDKVIPATTIASLRAAVGNHLWVTVAGSHCWLSANHAGFGDVINKILATPATALRGELHHLPASIAA